MAPHVAALTLDVAFDAGDKAVRAVASADSVADRLGLARAFGFRAISAWWRRLQGGGPRHQRLRPLLQTFDQAELPNSVAAVADDFGTAMAALNAENAAYVIGRAYTEMLPADYRATLGIYYTPPALTARLIAQATEAGVAWDSVRILDPACGGGAFLGPVAQQIVDALPGCSPHILLRNIGARLRGYEIDPFAAWLSQVALDAVLLPVTRAVGQPAPVVVAICDSLRQRPPRARFDLVIGNPPYGRIRLEAPERARFARSLYGHANLYGLFTDIALDHVKPGGVIAYVTPTSFLAGQYFKNLRALLARDAPPAAIDFVDARKGVFDSVLQETLLATYTVGAKQGRVRVNEISPAGGAALSVSDAGTATLPSDPAQPWLLPRSLRDMALVERLSRMRHRLADWGYEVSTGPLVWNRHKNQLASKPGADRRPLIWAESISSNGKFVYRANKKNHAPYFEVRSGDEWLLVTTACVLLQRTTAKEQSRRLIAACLPGPFLAEHGGSVVVENHLNMIKPSSGVTPIVAPSTLSAFLNSAAADRVFRCVSGSVAVSAFELESLPLPPPSEVTRLADLVANGAPQEHIEAECAKLYALDDESPAALRHPKGRRAAPASHFS